MEQTSGYDMLKIMVKVTFVGGINGTWQKRPAIISSCVAGMSIDGLVVGFVRA